MLKIYFIVIMFTLIYLFIAKTPTNEISKRIKKEGLYHLTTIENANSIMNEDIATILPSNRRSSYSNFFRKSVFFFVGTPSLGLIFFNMSISPRKELISIYIKGEDITEEMLEQIKYRKFDNAIMYHGTLMAKAEIVKLSTEDLKQEIHYPTPILLTSLLSFIFLALM